MAFWNESRRGRTDIDDMVRSSDSILNVVLILLLVAAVVSGAYYYGQLNPRVDQSTITNPVTSPSSSNASPIHPAPSPNPGP